MKTNSKKIIVSTLALAMGASLAGSIAGSVAWYQYSTRAAASMVGTAAGTSRNLEVSLSGADGTFSNYVTANAGTLKPVRAVHKTTITEGVSDLSDAALSTNDTFNQISFYDKPVYQYANSGKAITVSDLLAGYAVKQTFYFRVMDRVDGADPVAKSGKPIYLQDLQVVGANTSGTKLDLSNAIRVNFSYSLDSGSTVSGATFGNVASIKQSGRLDIGGASSVLDTDGIKQNDEGGQPVFYGATVAVANSGTEDVAVNAPSQVTQEMIVKDNVIKVRGQYKYNKTAQKFDIDDADADADGTYTHVATHASLDTLVAAQKAAEAASKPNILANGDLYVVDDEVRFYTISAVNSQTVRAISTEKANRGAGYFFVDDSDPYNLDGKGVKIAETTALDETGGTAYDMAEVTMTIWLEGWGLDAQYSSASWDYTKYIDSKVEVTARFVTVAE